MSRRAHTQLSAATQPKTQNVDEFSIKLAFSQARKPTADELTICATDECRELNRFFSKFCPSNASVEDLREHEMILMFGTNIAFRYFLQFFLEFSIRDLLRAGAIPDLIVLAFASDLDSLDRVGLLKTPEIECVRQYFDLLVVRGECELDDLTGARKTLDRLDA